jgi:hypothetical protein
MLDSMAGQVEIETTGSFISAEGRLQEVTFRNTTMPDGSINNIGC